jgi:hypothetical protein
MQYNGIDNERPIVYHTCGGRYMEYKTDRLAIRDSDGDLRNKLKALAALKSHGRTSSDVVRRLVDDLYLQIFDGRDPADVLREQAKKRRA